MARDIGTEKSAPRHRGLRPLHTLFPRTPDRVSKLGWARRCLGRRLSETLDDSIKPSKNIQPRADPAFPITREGSPLTVIFDSECEMCSHLANLLDSQQITTLPYQDLSPEDPTLSYNPRDRLVVVHNGSITAGATAVLEIAAAKYPRLKWIFRRFSSGRLLMLCDTAYGFVARRRTKVDRLFLLAKTLFGPKR